MEGIRRASVKRISVLEIESPKHRQKNVAGRDFYALSYRFAGEVVLESDGKRLLSGADTVTFTPKGVPYRTAIREDTRMIVVHFTLTKDIDIRHLGVVNGEGSDLRDLFLQLADRYTESEPDDFTCMSLFYQILATLERLAREKNATPACVLTAKRQIDENFADPDLSIADVARAAGVSDSYLRRAFRASYGESPVAYLAHVRVRRAKNLLESEFFTVAEIAALSGFHSAGYFIQCFRARTGETPAAYRARKLTPRG